MPPDVHPCSALAPGHCCRTWLEPEVDGEGAAARILNWVQRHLRLKRCPLTCVRAFLLSFLHEAGLGAACFLCPHAIGMRVVSCPSLAPPHSRDRCRSGGSAARSRRARPPPGWPHGSPRRTQGGERTPESGCSVGRTPCGRDALGSPDDSATPRDKLKAQLLWELGLLGGNRFTQPGLSIVPSQCCWQQQMHVLVGRMCQPSRLSSRLTWRAAQGWRWAAWCAARPCMRILPHPRGPALGAPQRSPRYAPY